ncbi:5889_t:CDS:2, partial [Cetraspora pellucida]
SFESNLKRFETLVTSNNKQKQKSRTYMQRETLHSSNKQCDNLNNQSIEYIRLHGMLFTKDSLEFFDDRILEIFIDKLFRLKDIQSYKWLEFCMRMVVINISSLYNYGNTENSSLRLTTSTNMDFNQILDLDPTFAEESRLTFTVMYQFMFKYLDSISLQGEVDISEGLLLYCEIVLLWMVANDVFNNFAEKSNNCIWRKFLDKSICPEIIEFSSNIEDSNYIDRLRPPPLGITCRRRARIMELGYLLTKSRKQELENLLAATREVTPPSSSRIATGYTKIVTDTNCLIEDLNMVKKKSSKVIIVLLV